MCHRSTCPRRIEVATTCHIYTTPFQERARRLWFRHDGVDDKDADPCVNEEQDNDKEQAGGGVRRKKD